MAALFGSITDFFSSVLGAIVNLLMTPFHIIEMVASGSVVITEAIGYIPQEIATFAFAAVAICVLYLIFGR